MGKEVLLRRDGPLQTEKGVVLHTGLPQILTGTIVDHVKAQQSVPGLSLCPERVGSRPLSVCQLIKHCICSINIKKEEVT